MIQKVTNWFVFYKDLFRYWVYVVAAVFALYSFILLFTPKPQMPANIKATLDSLTAVNQQLIEHQKQIDSTIADYKEEVNQIDNRVNNIKEKTTIVREYYREVGQQVTQYTPTQIDSFFKSRYNY